MRASPTVIGAFVVGAVVLGVGGVLLFSGGQYFKEKHYFVLFFQDSVDGLAPGSPVKLEGVKIGEVVDVHLEWDPQTVTFRIPVTVEVASGQSQKYGGGELVLTGDLQERLDSLIAKGLRASLATESFITGQLSIQLSFHPETPARFVGGEELTYPEMPTMQTGLSKVVKEFQEIRFRELFEDLHKTIVDIDRRVASDEVTRLINSVPETLDQYRKLGQKLDEKVGPLIDHVESASSEAKETFHQATATIQMLGDDVHELTTKLDEATDRIRELVDDVDSEVKPTAEELRETMGKLSETLRGIDDAARRVDLLLRDDSPTISELKRTLDSFRDAARAIKALADTLQQQPESILRGKGN